jgi:hypothetical protein
MKTALIIISVWFLLSLVLAVAVREMIRKGWIK